MEEIEVLPTEEKDKVYYFIDMAFSHHKAKKAFAKKLSQGPPGLFIDYEKNW